MGSTVGATRSGGHRTLLRTGRRIRSLHRRARESLHRHHDRIRHRRRELRRGRRDLSGGVRGFRVGRRGLTLHSGRVSTEVRRYSHLGRDRVSLLRGVSNFAGSRTGTRLLRLLSSRLARRGTIGVVSCRRRLGSSYSGLTGGVINRTVRHYTTSRSSRVAISIIPLPDSRVGNHVVNHRKHGVHTLRATANISLVVSSAPRTVALSDFSPMEHRVTHIALRGLVLSKHVRPTEVRRSMRGTAGRIRAAVGRANRHAVVSTNIPGLRPRLIGLLNGLGCHADCNRDMLGRSLRIYRLTNLVTTRVNTSMALTGHTNLLRSVNGTLSRRRRNSRVRLNIRITGGCHRGRIIIGTVRTRRNRIRTGALVTYVIRTTSTVSTTHPNTHHRGVRDCVGHLRGLRRVTGSFGNIRNSFTVRTNHRVHVVIGPSLIARSRVILVSRRVTREVRGRLRCPNRVGIGIVHRDHTISCTGWFWGPYGRGSLRNFFVRLCIPTGQRARCTQCTRACRPIKFFTPCDLYILGAAGRTGTFQSCAGCGPPFQMMV